MDTKKSAGEPSSRAACSACASEKARADQLGINCRWLIDRLDRVCHALAPGYVGTWQDRANKAVEAAEALTQNAQNQGLAPQEKPHD
jgi:hypothetical protein